MSLPQAKSVRVVMPFSEKSQERVIKMLLYTEKLGGLERTHNCLLSHTDNCDKVDEIIKICTRLFRETTLLRVRGNGDIKNRHFANTARDIKEMKIPEQGWLWLEPDAVPVRQDWLERIERDYLQAIERGKSFLGRRLFLENAQGVKTECMSKVAVYPRELNKHSIGALMAYGAPWNIYAAQEIVPRALFTSVIQEYEFGPESRLADIRDATHLYHGDPGGRLLDILAKELAPKKGKKRKRITKELATKIWWAFCAGEGGAPPLRHNQVAKKYGVCAATSKRIASRPYLYRVNMVEKPPGKYNDLPDGFLVPRKTVKIARRTPRV